MYVFQHQSKCHIDQESGRVLQWHCTSIQLFDSPEGELDFFVYFKVSADWSVSPAQRQWHYANDRSPILHATGCIADEEWCHWGGSGQGIHIFCSGIYKNTHTVHVSQKAHVRTHDSFVVFQTDVGWWADVGQWFRLLKGKLCTHRMLYGIL